MNFTCGIRGLVSRGMKPLFNILILLPLLCSSTVCFAQTTSTYSDELKTLKALIRKEQKKCPTLNCAGQEFQVEALNAAEMRALGNELRKDLRLAGRGLALDLWPDTILEGPFYVQYRVRMDRIERLLRNHEAIGYRIVFSDKAWNIDHCKPKTPGDREPSFRNCATGRIKDAGFVLNDLRAFRDESVIAAFQPDGDDRVHAQTDLSLNPVKRKLMSGFSRLKLPFTSDHCDATAVKATLSIYQNLVGDLIYDERGLWSCEGKEQGQSCYEKGALQSLFDGIAPKGVFGTTYQTDATHHLCDQGITCDVQLNVVCSGSDLVIELIDSTPQK